MNHYINRAARRYLITGAAEPQTVGWYYDAWNHQATCITRRYSGGCWALELGPVRVVRFFVTRGLRDLWISVSPSVRHAVGKRHPLVKAFRNVASGRAQPKREPFLCDSLGASW